MCKNVGPKLFNKDGRFYHSSSKTCCEVSWGWGGGGDLTLPQFRASPPEHFTACPEWSSAQNNYAKGLGEKRKF